VSDKLTSNEAIGRIVVVVTIIVAVVPLDSTVPVITNQVVVLFIINRVVVLFIICVLVNASPTIIAGSLAGLAKGSEMNDG
jgi:hypothetical protein